MGVTFDILIWKTAEEASKPVIQANEHMLEKYPKDARHDRWSRD